MADVIPAAVQRGFSDKFYEKRKIAALQAGGTWFVNSPEESLGFILADHGFDVNWVGNVCGTHWSHGHVTLSEHDREFWDWSWQKLAENDLAAIIGCVYSKTNSKVYYVGHSQLYCNNVSHLFLTITKLFSWKRHVVNVISWETLFRAPTFMCIHVQRTNKASAGLGFLQFCNLNSTRTKFILGFSLFMGLSVPQYFKEHELIAGYGPVHTHTHSFNDIVNMIFSSPATVAAFVAYFLDCTLLLSDSAKRRGRGWHWWEKYRSYKSNTQSEEFYALPYNLSRRWHWWEKYRSYKSDTQSEEFYALPYNLNRFFPPI